MDEGPDGPVDRSAKNEDLLKRRLERVEFEFGIMSTLRAAFEALCLREPEDPYRLALEGVAPRVSGMLFGALYSELVSAVCRLLDPEEGRGGRDQNLTLERLASDAERAGYEREACALREKLAEVRSTAEPIREHRNMLISHLDLRYADPAPIRMFVKPLRQSILAVEEFLVMLQRSCFGIEVVYEPPPQEGDGDAHRLLEAVADIAYLREREAALAKELRARRIAAWGGVFKET